MSPGRPRRNPHPALTNRLFHAILKVRRTSAANKFSHFHASRGSSGALYSKSAIGRVMPALRRLSILVCPLAAALKAESRATAACEPCQVRKEAALSSPCRVLRGRLARVGKKGNARKTASRSRRMDFNFNVEKNRRTGSFFVRLGKGTPFSWLPPVVYPV